MPKFPDFLIKSATFLCILICSFLVFSCFENSTDEKIILPNSLVIEVEYLGDGLVKANFTAQKAEYYKVSFGTPGESLTRVDGNSTTKTFSTKGDFTLSVQAHTTEKDFISGEQIIRMNAAALGLDPNTGYSSPTNHDGYNLVWADEFSGSELSSDWRFELGDGCPVICGWGSEELQFYKKENTTLADGNLIITAKKEDAGTRNYTSSRLNTQYKKSFKFGRVDIRAKLPKGQGFWPGFWMLGENIDDVAWPKTGAIHIMEMVGGNTEKKDATLYGTTYWDNGGINAFRREKTTLPFGVFNDEFHVFSIIWDAKKIDWLLDGVVYHTLDISLPDMDEFQKPFFFIFNTAVGGREPGSPDVSSIFPQEMKVDYIRVFQKK